MAAYFGPLQGDEMAEGENVEKLDLGTTDHLLGVLLLLLEDNKGLSIGVTLTVHGVVYSGLLISSEAYFRRLFEIMDGTGGGAATIAAGVRGMMAKEGATKMLTEGYVFLRGAILSANVRFPINDEGLWKIRGADIDGFLLGNMTVGPPNP
jgi:hypothetical protein